MLPRKSRYGNINFPFGFDSRFTQKKDPYPYPYPYRREILSGNR